MVVNRNKDASDLGVVIFRNINTSKLTVMIIKMNGTLSSKVIIIRKKSGKNYDDKFGEIIRNDVIEKLRGIIYKK